MSKWISLEEEKIKGLPPWARKYINRLEVDKIDMRFEISELEDRLKQKEIQVSQLKDEVELCRQIKSIVGKLFVKGGDSDD